MERNVRIAFDAKVIIGLVIICAGVLFLLQNLGYFTNINFWDFWPVFPILIGLNMLAQPREMREPIGGAILIIIGLLFLLRNLSIIPWGIGDFWPIILILVGLFVVKNALWRGSGKTPASNDYINLSMVLGGGDFKFNSDNLKGGKVDAIMGGGTIDLRNADIQEEEVVIEVFALWGGIDIRVPEHWQVNVKGSPLLGAMENKATHVAAGKPAKKLTVRGTAIMGGVEIKN